MEQMEKKFEMRPLEGGDIFIMTSIISKIGVKNIAKCFKSPDVAEARNAGDVPAEEIGQMIFCEMADLILERLEYCEAGICKLLSRLSGKSVEEIKKLGAVEYLEMFMTVVKDEKFADFFTQAYELLKRMI